MPAAPLTENPRLDEILRLHREALGPDYDRYRNHCLRLLSVLAALHPLTPEEADLCAIAAAFHDLGIWTAKTWDYLAPSEHHAVEWLRERGREADAARVRELIERHHSILPVKGDALVEAFRRADLVDVSLGVARFGLDAAFLRAVRRALPLEGFHLMLAGTGLRHALRHPLRPMPMLRW